MPLPLAGLRILAVTQYGAGPFATLHLADLGAEVITIEDPGQGGDISRSIPPYAAEGDSLFYQCLNRNKKSITLNLQHPDGYATFLDLAEQVDAVFNNLRGDLPKRLRITYADLRHRNPRIVCCSLSGFGDGLRASDPGYDYLVQAEAGFMALTGEPGQPPTRSGVSIVDFTTGYAAAMALLAGMLEAQRTGKGRDLGVSLLDAARSMLNYLAIWHLNECYQPARMPRSSHPSLVPSQVFPTADGYIMVMCQKEKFWQALCEQLEIPELRDDPRFADFSGRLEHRDVLIPLLEARFLTRTSDAWLLMLHGEVPVAPVNDFATSMQGAELDGGIITVEHPTLGTLRELSCPVRLDEPLPPATPAPALGEHTDEVLAGYLGYTADRIARLRTSGAL